MTGNSRACRDQGVLGGDWLRASILIRVVYLWPRCLKEQLRRGRIYLVLCFQKAQPITVEERQNELAHFMAVGTCAETVHIMQGRKKRARQEAKREYQLQTPDFSDRLARPTF